MNKMFNILALLISAGGLFAFADVCRADTWQRAEVYMMPWDAETFVPVTPQNARQQMKPLRVFSKKVPEIVHILAIQNLKSEKEIRVGSVRLVVDLYTDTGARISYYADRSELFSADGKSKRSIDHRFRDYFAKLMREESGAEINKD
jgi:hypothetical protein